MTGGTEVMPVEVAPTPTTMSGAASEGKPSPAPAARRRTRRHLLPAAAAVSIALVGGVLLVRGLGPRPPTVVLPAARDAGAPITLAQAKDAGAPIVLNVVKPDTGAVEPDPPSRRYSIAVRVRPRSALIELDGARVGKEGSFARKIIADGSSHTLRFSSKGYAGQTVVFGETTPPPKLIALERLPADVSPGPGPNPPLPVPPPHPHPGDVGPSYETLVP
jgi:hypothetical protein